MHKVFLFSSYYDATTTYGIYLGISFLSLIEEFRVWRYVYVYVKAKA